MGSYDTLEALIANHPTGNPGEFYLVGPNADLYVWDSNTNLWIDTGILAGPQGPAGPQGTIGDTGPIGPQGEQLSLKHI